MEDNLQIINGRQPQKNEKNGKRPKKKWKTNQSTKINLIGCDTIVNSPSSSCYRGKVKSTPRFGLGWEFDKKENR